MKMKNTMTNKKDIKDIIVKEISNFIYRRTREFCLSEFLTYTRMTSIAAAARSEPEEFAMILMAHPESRISNASVSEVAEVVACKEAMDSAVELFWSAFKQDRIYEEFIR